MTHVLTFKATVYIEIPKRYSSTLCTRTHVRFTWADILFVNQSRSGNSNFTREKKLPLGQQNAHKKSSCGLKNGQKGMILYWKHTNSCFSAANTGLLVVLGRFLHQLLQHDRTDFFLSIFCINEASLQQMFFRLDKVKIITLWVLWVV